MTTEIVAVEIRVRLCAAEVPRRPKPLSACEGKHSIAFVIKIKVYFNEFSNRSSVISIDNVVHIADPQFLFANS